MRFFNLSFLIAIVILTFESPLFSNGSGSTQYYFAYGSNLSYHFLKERLKNGNWIDGWHKDGELVGTIPVDMGCYELPGYEFGYTLNVEPFGDIGTAANIVQKSNCKVYGVLYKLSQAHLEQLDKSEDVPIAYSRVAVKVNRVATSILGNFSSGDNTTSEIEAWIYVGNTPYVIQEVNPDPEYVDLLISGAYQHNLPLEYIEGYILLPFVPSCLCVEPVL